MTAEQLAKPCLRCKSNNHHTGTGTYRRAAKAMEGAEA